MKRLKADYGEIAWYPEAALKQEFLNDALTLCKNIGRYLKEFGYQCEAHINKAGIAVSGEVSMSIIVPQTVGYGINLYVQVGASHGLSPYRRKDGVYILVQHRQRIGEADKPGYCGTRCVGPNAFLAPGFGPELLGKALRDMAILGRKYGVQPVDTGLHLKGEIA